MKIIKEGDLDKLNKSIMQPVIFKCERCGCEFEANRGEYELKRCIMEQETNGCRLSAPFAKTW